jgi:hypothetical protein
LSGGVKKPHKTTDWLMSRPIFEARMSEDNAGMISMMYNGFLISVVS